MDTEDSVMERALPSRDETRARNALRPAINTAVTLSNLRNLPTDSDEALALVNALSEQANSVNAGDLSRGEAMLTTQAHTLDALFSRLVQMALKADHIQHMESYMKLAIKAQNQTRTTWEAISRMKHPPQVNYVGQANIAHGPQQVNNGYQHQDSEIAHNELLSATCPAS